MGEETDIAEPMSTEDVVAAEDVTANEPSKESKRKRIKHLHRNLRMLIEFYMGDANLSKDRFMSQLTQGQPFVYVDLSVFLTFNKVRTLTSNVEDLTKALSQSEILQLSDDGSRVCRKTPIMKKENEDDCTIYVEQLPPDIDHETLTKIFTCYGVVDYVSLPRFVNGKFKGFAFVEFRDPESARRALEALKIKGCCLSPQMAPEDLMSIKNFEQNKENKVNKIKNEAGTFKTKFKTSFKTKDSVEVCKSENYVDSKDTSCNKEDEDSGNVKKEKRKRKSCDASEKISSKAHNSKVAEISEPEKLENLEEKGSKLIKESGGEQIEKSCEQELQSNGKLQDTKHKKNDKKENQVFTQPGPNDIKEQNVDCNDKLDRKILKRKHSEDEVFASEDDKIHKEEAEPKNKKLKIVNEEFFLVEDSKLKKEYRSEQIKKSSEQEFQNKGKVQKTKDKKNDETENPIFTQPGPNDIKEQNKLDRKMQKRKHSEDEVSAIEDDTVDKEEAEPKNKRLKIEHEEITQTEEESEEDETAKQKKKRKKKKKVKRNKCTAITLGLKVLPKKEWKLLRNKYLDMQRNMMGSLKQHLMHSKWDKNKAVVPESEEGQSKRTRKFTPVPGIVIKVTLEQPISSEIVSNAKSEMRIHPDICYVDVTEGSPIVYLRTTTPQLAASLVQSRHWPTMELIQGDEETEYWNKMNMDREEKLKKNKANQRGRTKLLKRAERFQGKHITTFESSSAV